MTKLHAILELPNKGAFAPNKFGCRHGDFIKIEIPDEKLPAWVFNAKIYDLENDKERDQFNKICEEVIPHCHQRKMRVIVRIILIESEEKSEVKKTKPKEKKAGKQSDESPPAPSLPMITVPSGGE